MTTKGGAQEKIKKIKKEYIGERKERSACKIRSRVIGGENRPRCDCLHPIPRAETV